MQASAVGTPVWSLRPYLRAVIAPPPAAPVRLEYPTPTVLRRESLIVLAVTALSTVLSLGYCTYRLAAAALGP